VGRLLGLNTAGLLKSAIHRIDASETF